ncbi:MAG: hypothetical protein LBK68_03330, partial [Candidatus Margulisbacteria bacterium]|nr:hypothetical protein [Candidatus Margulisiibacteriota bacterium]
VDFPELESFYLREKQAFTDRRDAYAEQIGGELELQKQIAEFYATHHIMRSKYNPNDTRIIGKQKPLPAPVNLEKYVIEKYPELADVQFPKDIASIVHVLIVENTANMNTVSLEQWAPYAYAVLLRLESAKKYLGQIQEILADFPSLTSLYVNELNLFTETQTLYQNKKQAKKE